MSGKIYCGQRLHISLTLRHNFLSGVHFICINLVNHACFYKPKELAMHERIKNHQPS